MYKTPLDLIKQRRVHNYWWARINPESWNTGSRKSKAFPFYACKSEEWEQPRLSEISGPWWRQDEGMLSSLVARSHPRSTQRSPSTLQGAQGSKSCAPLPSWQEQDTDITSRDVSQSRVRSQFSMALRKQRQSRGSSLSLEALKWGINPYNSQGHHHLITHRC